MGKSEANRILMATGKGYEMSLTVLCEGCGQEYYKILPKSIEIK